MIDTHSHLFDEAFDLDRKECIDRALNNGIEKIMIIGFSIETNSLALSLSQNYNWFYNTAGLHPDTANVDNKQSIEYLEDFIKNNKVYGIGECGLDYHWVSDNKELQKELFIAQIELSIKYDLPLIVHMRDATADTYDILSQYKGKIRGVMHCYSGSYEMALKFIELGFYISIGGPVTYKNSIEPKRVAQNIPLDRLLIETDCPYLPPVPFRGKRNESSYVRFVLEEISNLRGVDKSIIEKETENNAIKLFSI